VENLIALALTVLLYAFLIWVLFFALQLSDFFANLVDMRGAHDYRLKNRTARRRVTEYFWSIPVVFTLGLGFALGIDYAGRLLFDDSRVRDGLILLAILLFVAFGAGIGIVFALSRAEGGSYAMLRENLQEDATMHLTRNQMQQFRSQLEELDSRQRHIRLGVRDRAALPRTRSALKSIADSFRAVPPSGLRAMTAIGWPFAWAYLWRGNLLRACAPLLALINFLLALVVVIVAADPLAWWLPAALLIAFLVSSLLAVASARASLASKTAWHAVYLKQRTEVEDLLLEMEKSSRKGVAGLGDRVARALQILREQQE
jgi:ABC-type multidrug transport system fused ATPase/permease subunit